MSTKRRVGVSSATTDAMRRQLMQPVPSWEKVWVAPDAAPGSTIRIRKWVKTSKIQHFSDDEEGEADEPLAPLPDEVEVVEGDEEDQDENAAGSAAPPSVRETTEAPAPEEELPSKPASPKPQLSMGLEPAGDLDDPETNNALDESLKAMETSMDPDVGVGLPDVGVSLDADASLMDISGLAPDGLPLEGDDLSQINAGDALLGGPLQMDDSEDPFAQT
ncbi:hypothetical protein R3P38DRAFT_3249377 [Favolaschia claudopus]|uniref:Uncharacterized protein n=1 Tax=Favolaschia claudopus TaxID=2862362 RepID=A0AAW0EGN7_9AGAR